MTRGTEVCLSGHTCVGVADNRISIVCRAHAFVIVSYIFGACAGDVCVCVCVCVCARARACVGVRVCCACMQTSTYTAFVNSYVCIQPKQMRRYALHTCVDMYALTTACVYVCEFA